MFKIRYQPHTLGKYFTWWDNRSDKFRRKERLCRKKWFRRYQKRIFRDWQRHHEGHLPDLSVIPTGLYCYTLVDGETVMCPHYRWIEIQKVERDEHVGIIATYQTGIGRCALINRSDDDSKGWGLLWDRCKECGFNVKEKK